MGNNVLKQIPVNSSIIENNKSTESKNKNKLIVLILEELNTDYELNGPWYTQDLKFSN